MAEKKEKKLKALRPCRIINRKLGISYSFKPGEEVNVSKDHLNVLLDLGVLGE